MVGKDGSSRGRVNREGVVGGKVGSYKTSKHLEHRIMTLTVPPQTHHHWAVIENVKQSVSCSIAECTHISGLLAPQAKVGIGRKCVKGAIENKL